MKWLGKRGRGFAFTCGHHQSNSRLLVEVLVPERHVFGEPAGAVGGVQQRVEQRGLREVVEVVHHGGQDEDGQEPG